MLTPAAVAGGASATYTQAAAPLAGANGIPMPSAGGVGSAPFEVVTDPVTVAHVQNPDCDDTITSPTPTCVPDPLSVGNAAPSDCLPQPTLDLNSGGTILTWDAIDGTNATLSTALSTPLTLAPGPKPVTRQTMTFTSSDNTIVRPQETQSSVPPPANPYDAVSFNIPDALPVPLAGIVAADMLCSGASPGSVVMTVAGGAFSDTYNVSVADVTSVKLDMDITNGVGPCDPIDASTSAFVGNSFDVGVCLINPTGSVPVAAYGFRVLYNDTIILAPEVADVGTALDDNPDANAGTTTFTSVTYPNDLGGGWDCSGGVGAFPKGDENAATGPGNGRAFSGGCSSAAGPNTLIQGPLAVITFDALATGSDTLVLQDVSIVGDDLNEIGSCNPSVDIAILCVGGSVTVGTAPTFTPTATPTDTATNTPTNTSTNTPTPTNTPAGPTVNKSPAISNLFLCDDTDGPGPICSAPGAGEVVIQEIVNNVTEPLGAWEIQIKFDHKIFNVSIDPNEALFTGFGRTPDCSASVVTENWILFGCVSTGAVGAGFTGGPAVLATVTLTPNEDLRFRLHPGNDNGVTRMILDENCEVANDLGHPQPGSINGGLALECGDASVTVRILAGDLDHD
jgi:hypothetical protein